MNYLIKSFILFIALMCANISHGASQKPQQPDFAFPEKVEKTASADLERALSKGDGRAAVDAMIRLGIAKAIVNTDSLPVVLERINTLTAREKDPVTKAVLNTLSANIYCRIYDNDEWVINRRPALASAGEDYTLWSRSQFLDRVIALTRASLADTPALAAVPVENWKGVVDINRASRQFYPTMLDFVGSQGIANLRQFSSNLSVLNPALLSHPTDASLFPGQCPPLADILEIYSTLLEFHAEDSAPYFINAVNVRKFIAPDLFGISYEEAQKRLRDELLNIYKANRANEYSGVCLLAATENCEPGTGARETVEMLREFAANHPSFYAIEEVNNRIKYLTNPQADVSLPRSMAPGVPFKVQVRSLSCTTVKVDFYRLPSMLPSDDNTVRLTNLPPVTLSKSVTFDSEVPFEATKTFEIQFDTPGMYTYRVTADGKNSRNNYQLLNCSRLSLGVGGVVDDNAAWVMDPVTGEPVEGAQVWYLPWSRKADFSRLPGTTSANGSIPLGKIGNGKLGARKGDDLYSPLQYYYPGRSFDNEVAPHAQIFTSLRLYRPGDTMKFSVVAYDQSATERTLADSRQLRMVLHDVNYQPVDTVMVTTDSWGRAEGEFSLPSAGLTGLFTLEAYQTGGRKGRIGLATFEVSDYKLPTFTVETVAVNRPTALASGASVEGKAQTYSGFPVADAQVKATLQVQVGRWWWARQSPEFFTAETTTDASGSFTVDIPAEAIASAPAPDGLFTCNIQVTSADGESHAVTATFNMGKPLILKSDIPNIVFLGAPVKASVEATDVNGAAQSIPLRYKVLKDSVEVSSGNVTSGKVDSLISRLAPGTYSFEFCAVDSALADAVSAENVIIYGSAGTPCPVARPLWVPRSEVEADSKGSATIPFGSDAADAWVRVLAAAYPSQMFEQKWIRTAAGMQDLTVTLPEGVDKATVELSCIRNFKSYSSTVTIRRASSQKSIKTHITTFRDRVTPNDREKITIKVVPQGDTQALSAVILDMSNLAIDQLQNNPLSMPAFQLPSARLRVGAPMFDESSVYVSHDYRRSRVRNIESPVFNFYGQSMFPTVLYETIAMPVMAKSSYRIAGLKMADTANAVESVEEEAAAEDKVALTEGASTNDAGAGSIGNDDAAREKQPECRPSEIPLAFFRPMLNTAPDGSLEITYDVPDANTTWVLRALAYNKSLLSDAAEVNIVSSKPVMVSLNAPRFVRGGDSLTLAASVMNNTGESRSIKVASRAMLSGSDKVLFSDETEVKLDSMASAVVRLPVKVSGDECGIEYVVFASSDDFTDGERTLMPVLPSEQDVTESEIRYIAPGNPHFEIQLPALGKGDRAYLNFTENPSWMVVSALPGLRENSINSSVEAAAALFSACVARGIMRSNPEISKVVRQWVANPEDSALVSNLQKNQELKSMLLSATPWVSEALSDTQRMQRLALIFDHRQVQGVIDNALDILAKTRADGGWAWTANYPRVSEWASYSVMEMLGDLRSLGWLPADKRLKGWIGETCAYLDREAVESYRKYPASDFWLYTVIRDKFPDHKPSTAASRVIEAQVQKCLAKWREAGVALRAVYAQILNSHGYNATARQLIASLTEMATRTPEKGMWWQQLDHTSFWCYDRIGQTSMILDAFNAVDPSSECVDAIRQWLFLNKMNNDWGSATITTQVIASILNSGSQLKVNTRGTAVHVGDELIVPDRQEYATGAFTQNITPMLSKPAMLTVDRQADYPSVVGVVTMRTLPMASIKGAGCAEASISKSLCIMRDGQWVPSETFDVGDKVRVELILKVEDDLSYIVIEDLRAAGLEPVEQLPAPVWAEGLCFYRENRDSQTNIFIDRLPRGTYRLAYELYASQAGTFSSGAARLQSQYNPIVAAHSASAPVIIK